MNPWTLILLFGVTAILIGMLSAVAYMATASKTLPETPGS
jgi:hypothetical protein